MKKFIFSIICIIVAAIVVASVYQREEETSSHGKENYSTPQSQTSVPMLLRQ